MATSLRNPAPITFVARSLSDAVDATNLARGAMRALTNLVPDPTTRGNFVCRPGQLDVVDFSSLNDPTFISAELAIGNTVYGLIATDDPFGKDRPFAADLLAGTLLPVQGIESGNTPTAAPATGDWEPPVIWQVGSRILVAHPGFPGDDIKFGWFDISSFRSDITVDIISGTPFLFGFPSLIGVQPGLLVTGSVAIPDGTRVKNVFPLTQSVNDFTGTSHSTDIIDGISLADSVEMQIGKTIMGPGIQPGTTIIGTPATVSIQLSQPATSSTTGTFRVIGNMPSVAPYAYLGDFVSGDKFITNVVTAGVDLHTGQLIVASPTLVAAGTYVESIVGTTVNLTQELVGSGNNQYFSAVGNVIEMTADATATGTGSLVLLGGTPEAPLWGAGDTAINALPSVPVGGAQMNGRAWFAAGDDGIPWSDSLLPCIRTAATQALTVNNSRPVTALGPLMLAAPIVGGIVQSLVAFQGGASMQQITGDPATNNLKMDLLPVPTGTLAPNTIAPSTMGLFFVSPEGLRVIDFQGRVSDPIGQDGDGVVAPFLAVAAPPMSGPPASRMTAAAGGRTLRIDVPNADEEMISYWYDLTRRIWTGPHTGGASLVKVWGDTFLLSSAHHLCLCRADDVPRADSVYVENDAPLDYEWEMSLLPDTGEMAQNVIIESAIMVALQPGEQAQVNFLDEIRGPLDGVSLRGLDIPEALWGTSLWGVTLTGPDPGTIRQRQLPWTLPLVFKQGRINIRGLSSATVALGNFYMRYQVLGYLLQVPQIPTETDDFWLLTEDGVTILRAEGNINLTPG